MTAKAVLDTNVLVSALIWDKGKPNRLLHKCLRGEITLIVSQETLKELETILLRERKFDQTREDIDEYLALLSNHSTHVTPKTNISAVEADPSDNKFIECALEGKADYIVSGDKHLLNIKEYKGVKILDCTRFLNLLEKHQTSNDSFIG